MTPPDGKDTFRCWIHPHATWLTWRAGTAQFVNSRLRVEYADGSITFDEQLGDVMIGREPRMPYLVLEGLERRHARASLKPPYWAYANLAALAIGAIMGAGIADALDWGQATATALSVSLAFALVFAVTLLARRSSVEAPFLDRAKQLDPGIAHRRPAIVDRSTPEGQRRPKVGVLLVAPILGFMIGGLLTMATSIALRPDAPTDGTDTDGTMLRIVLLVVFSLAATVHFVIAATKAEREYYKSARDEPNSYERWLSIVLAPFGAIILIGFIAYVRVRL